MKDAADPFDHDDRNETVCDDSLSNIQTIPIDPGLLGGNKRPSLKMRRPFDPDILIGIDSWDEETGLLWRVTDLIGNGGMSYIYRLIPYDGAGRAFMDGEPVPARAMKVCQDLCELHNKEIEQTSEKLEEFCTDSVAGIPAVYEHGRLDTKRLGGRRPAYLIEELLAPNALVFLRAHALIRPDEGIHPVIALLMTKDLVDYAVALEQRGYGNYDTHVKQLLSRMVPLPDEQDLRIGKYTAELDGLRKETVVADNDKIVKLYENITNPCFTIGYGDPWFPNFDTLEFIVTPHTIAYQIGAVLYTLVTGRQLLSDVQTPKGLTNEQMMHWWQTLCEGRPVPSINADVEPLFTKREIYESAHRTVGVPYPTEKWRKQSLLDKLRRKKPQAYPLTPDQQTIENIITFLCQSLNPPKGRMTPREQQKFLKEYFPDISNAFSSDPDYHKRYTSRTSHQS